MITNEDVLNVAEFLGKSLSEEQMFEVMKLYPQEQLKDPGIEWYYVVENIINEITG